MTKRRFSTDRHQRRPARFFRFAAGRFFVTTRWYNSNLQPVDIQKTSKQRFEIARGASLDEIAVNLQKEELIRDAAAFKWHMKINGQAHSLQAGVFELSPSNYASEIADILSSGLQANVQVTILPAQHLKEIEASLVEQGFTALDAQKALQADNYSNHRLMRFIDQGEEGTLEGYLAPESFAVDQFNAAAAERLIRQSLDVFADYLTEEIQAAITNHEELDTVHQGIILASILEKRSTARGQGAGSSGLSQTSAAGDETRIRRHLRLCRRNRGRQYLRQSSQPLQYQNPFWLAARSDQQCFPQFA